MLAGAGIEQPALRGPAAAGGGDRHGPRASLLAHGRRSRCRRRSCTSSAGCSARRAAREPMAYILGRAEFWSLGFAVGPGVLVPRPDTETLIEAAHRRVPGPRPAAARARHRRRLRLPAADPAAALPVGARASAPISARRRWPAPRRTPSAWASPHGSGWCGRPGPAASPARSTSSSATRPISRTAEIDGLQPEVARFEPRLALDGGPDGLAPIGRSCRRLPRLLAIRRHGAPGDRPGPGRRAVERDGGVGGLRSASRPGRSGWPDRALPRGSTARADRLLRPAPLRSADRTAAATCRRRCGSPSATCTVGIANRMPFSAKALLEHGVGAAADDELLARLGHHLQPDLHRELAHRLDALHLQRLDDVGRELRVGHELLADLLDDLLHLVEVGVVGDVERAACRSPSRGSCSAPRPASRTARCRDSRDGGAA